MNNTYTIQDIIFELVPGNYDLKDHEGTVHSIEATIRTVDKKSIVYVSNEVWEKFFEELVSQNCDTDSRIVLTKEWLNMCTDMVTTEKPEIDFDNFPNSVYILSFLPITADKLIDMVKQSGYTINVVSDEK